MTSATLRYTRDIFSSYKQITGQFIRFEVVTAVIMENVVFLDIKTNSYLTGSTLLIHYRAQQVNMTCSLHSGDYKECLQGENNQ
jgi:predicted RNA-binding protein